MQIDINCTYYSIKLSVFEIRVPDWKRFELFHWRFSECGKFVTRCYKSLWTTEICRDFVTSVKEFSNQPCVFVCVRACRVCVCVWGGAGLCNAVSNCLLFISTETTDDQNSRFGSCLLVTEIGGR